MTICFSILSTLYNLYHRFSTQMYEIFTGTRTSSSKTWKYLSEIISPTAATARCSLLCVVTKPGVSALLLLLSLSVCLTGVCVCAVSLNITIWDKNWVRHTTIFWLTNTYTRSAVTHKHNSIFHVHLYTLSPDSSNANQTMFRLFAKEIKSRQRYDTNIFRVAHYLFIYAYNGRWGVVWSGNLGMSLLLTQRNCVTHRRK